MDFSDGRSDVWIVGKEMEGLIGAINARRSGMSEEIATCIKCGRKGACPLKEAKRPICPFCLKAQYPNQEWVDESSLPIQSRSIYGYFDKPHQCEPTYNPSLDVNCPFCHKELGYPQIPIKTICFMREGDTKSYFYRCHRKCYESASPEEISAIDEMSLLA